MTADNEPATLEEAFAQVNAMGWRVNNLFQLDSGLWQANIREAHGYQFSGWGQDITPLGAIRGALIVGRGAAAAARERAQRVAVPPVAELLAPPGIADLF